MENIPKGFKNIGAICYFNSILQALLNINPFRKCSFLDNFLRNDNEWDDLFSSKLLNNICNGYLPGNQSASEYLLLLIDKFDLYKLFEKKYKISRECVFCNKNFTSIDTDIIGLINDNFIEVFTTESIILDFNCDNCKQKTKLNEKSGLIELSSIVAVSCNKYFEKKNIKYPLQFRVNNNFYNLKSVVEHVGNLSGGHYIAKVKKNDKYFLIDDNNVIEISDIDPTNNTYLLFYEIEELNSEENSSL